MSLPSSAAAAAALLLLLTFSSAASAASASTICIIGSGISGSSLSHFLRYHSSHLSPDSSISTIHVFERNAVVGGRMSTISLSNHTLEAGASILHPKNYHAVRFRDELGLRVKGKVEEDSDTIGVWDGERFVFKSIIVDSKSTVVRKVVEKVNAVRLLWRYGFSLMRMQSFVESMLGKFLKYYESVETRPVFETVEEMLRWSGLYDLTRRSLEEELIDAGLSPLLIQELVTVITRINYGQSVKMSGLAGAVSLAGSGGGLWAIEGGNWQMAAGLINGSDVELHLNEEIVSVSNLGDSYELNSTQGNSYACDVAVVATPLDEVNIQFDPPVSVPPRKLQHTYTTFIRGLLNPMTKIHLMVCMLKTYFGLKTVSEIPELVGTLENPDIPFSSVSVLKKHFENDMSYKMFSRQPADDALLDQLFSVRKETIRINWGAYPQYKAPETFAPFILDGSHLYYINAFESAASAMETGAVAAENMARLILSRLSSKSLTNAGDSDPVSRTLHVDL
ncbi:Farnesylcysteine lyase-like protein [Drosera capensis]